jgi:CDP-glycerol glycerophosphotransferase
MTSRPVGDAEASPIVADSHRPQRPKLRRRIQLTLLHAANRMVPKSVNKIVLHGIPDYEDGIMAIASGLSRRGYKPVLLLNNPALRQRQNATTGLAIRTSKFRSLCALFHYLTAGSVFTTHGLLGDRVPPRRQCVVNLWHAEPPSKAIGQYEDGQPPIQATFAPVMSSIGQAYRSAEFGLHPSQAPILGAPRNDRLLLADPVEVRRLLLGPNADMMTFLWMPTFRASGGVRASIDTTARHPGAPFGVRDLDRLDRWLVGRDMRLIVKRHPLDADTLPDHFRAIHPLEQLDLDRLNLSVYTALSAFNVLITDISSVWIDYLLLNRPIVFAFPDIEDYRANRGIVLEPYSAWVPGPIVKTIDELLEQLDRIASGWDDYKDERLLALRRHHKYSDAGSAERILDFLGLKEDQ